MRMLICLAAALTLLAAGPAAGQDKMYKWVDEDGNVTYQDRPPPGEDGEVETFTDPTNTASAAPAAEQPDVDVVLYSIIVCDACDLVRTLLRKRGIPFEEKDAEGNVEVQKELKEIAGVLSVPVLLIGDEVLKGYNEQLILNELEEAGFDTSMKAEAPGSGQESGGSSLTREDLEGMTPEEIEQAARDAVSRGEDSDLFEEDEGLSTLNEDIFDGDEDDGPAGDDVTQWEEIPEDERIRVSE